jgi:hypothetical protein
MHPGTSASFESTMDTAFACIERTQTPIVSALTTYIGNVNLGRTLVRLGIEDR